jgi:hypothetical protein
MRRRPAEIDDSACLLVDLHFGNTVASLPAKHVQAMPIGEHVRRPIVATTRRMLLLLHFDFVDSLLHFVQLRPDEFDLFPVVAHGFPKPIARVALRFRRHVAHALRHLAGLLVEFSESIEVARQFLRISGHFGGNGFVNVVGGGVDFGCQLLQRGGIAGA